MKKIFTTLLLCSLSALALAACSAPQPQPTEKKPAAETPAPESDPAKKAILVVSFGTSYADTRALTIDAIESDIQAAFPDYEVRRAFTSQTIINKLAERDNLQIQNVQEAMDALVADGFGTVICQPTHIMNGFEYDDMVAEVTPYKEKIADLRIGLPLLSHAEDYSKLTAALKNAIPPLAEKEALIFMGHGTEHPANSAYAALAYQFLLDDMSNIYIGTVEGFPDLDAVIKQLKKNDIDKVYLTPLMVVAGDHANNDMAGDEEDSWKTILKAEGYETAPILRGLGEYPSVRALYVAHVADAIAGNDTEEAAEE